MQIFMGYLPLTGCRIDFAESPSLQKLYSSIRNSLGKSSNAVDVLQVVAESVGNAFPIRKTGAVNAFTTHLIDEKGQKASLEDHLQAGIGDCIYASAAVGVLTERLAKEGYIDAAVSIGEARTQTEWEEGHAWTKVRTPKKTYVVDVMHDFVGEEQEYKPTLDRILHQITMSS